MNNQTEPRPEPQVGVKSHKYETALRIAKNIAAKDVKLRQLPPEQWLPNSLYAYLERAWRFFWNKESEKWEQQ